MQTTYYNGDCYIAEGDTPEVRYRVVDGVVEIWEPKPRRNPVSGPCIHLGSQIDSVKCPSCRGSVTLKVFACEVHGRCTIQKRVDTETACCSACSDYESKPDTSLDKDDKQIAQEYID